MATEQRPITLYVCYGTFALPWGHPCRAAAAAVADAGWEVDTVRVYGVGYGPDLLAETPGRRRVRRISGQKQVPVLEFSDGRVISGSQRIVAWAEAHFNPEADDEDEEESEGRAGDDDGAGPEDGDERSEGSGTRDRDQKSPN